MPEEIHQLAAFDRKITVAHDGNNLVTLKLFHAFTNGVMGRHDGDPVDLALMIKQVINGAFFMRQSDRHQRIPQHIEQNRAELPVADMRRHDNGPFAFFQRPRDPVDILDLDPARDKILVDHPVHPQELHQIFSEVPKHLPGHGR